MAAPRGPGGVWLWSVAVLAAAVGVNLATPVVAAAALRDSLRTLLGTSQVDVLLEAWPPPALWWGTADRMTIVARDVPAGDLRLERFGATLQRVRVDPRALYAERTLVIRAIGSGSAHGTVAQEVLARALARQQPGIRVDALVLQPGRVLVRGAVRILGVEVDLDGAGRLVLDGSDTLDLLLDRATVSGGGASAALGGHLNTRVPAVLRVPALPLGFRLTGVRMEDGRLVLDAATGPS